jgi:hypothetical protein
VKKFLVALSLMTLSLVAEGDVKNVNIQCNADGPVYKGKLYFEADLSKWPVSVGCAMIGADDYGPYSSITFKVPSFKLSFNGLTYSNYSDSDTVEFKTSSNYRGSCSPNVLSDSSFRFPLKEKSTLRPVYFESNVLGGVFTDLAIAESTNGTGQRCSITAVK